MFEPRVVFVSSRLSMFAILAGFLVWSLPVVAQQKRAEANSTSPSKPNIIYILSDDTAMGDLGCYGQEIIQTPHLDQMAAEGTRYLQCYSGTSVCAPSRTSLMTGLHTGHSPVRANYELQPEGQLPLPSETTTIAMLLKDAGYQTTCVGKWGMGMFQTTGSPLKKGFDHFFGYNCQRHAHSYFPAYLWDDDQRISLPGNNGKSIGKTYSQNLIQDEALSFIRDNKDQPFFLFYAITLPHSNNEIDDLGQYANQPWTEQQKNYAAQVTRLDRDAGQVLELLKELGIAENTLVFFSGDNGSSFNENSDLGKLFNQSMSGSLRGFKRGLYEGGLRQAAISWWPGTIPAGRVSQEPWAFWDFLPTAAELAGITIPQDVPVDGLSLVDFLKGGPAPERDYFYWELHEQASIQAVRFGDWKAVKNGPQNAIELYDLSTDTKEEQNLAQAHPKLVKQAREFMEQAHTDDPNWPMVENSKERKAQRPPIGR